jgi:hypothetical protein
LVSLPRKTVFRSFKYLKEKFIIKSLEPKRQCQYHQQDKSSTASA